MEEIVEEDNVFYDHFVTLQDENYGSGDKGFQIERIQLSNKKVIDRVEMNVYLSQVAMPGLKKLQQASGEVLADNVS